jgi:hypothetical protein
MASGNSFHVVKESIKKEAVLEGWPTEKLLDGTIIPKSEADVSKEECSIGIETAHRIAAEMSISLIEYDENGHPTKDGNVQMDLYGRDNGTKY